MKLLFILGSVYPLDDANSNIINRIATNLYARYEGIQIFELGFNSQPITISESVVNNVKVYGMGDPFKTRLSEELSSYLDSISDQSNKRRIALLIKRPNLAIEYIVKRLRYGNIQKCYKMQIKEICIKNSIDVIICVSYPFLTAMAAAKLKMRLPFIYYQLDPYFSHYLQPNRRKALKQERYVCKRADAILMTNLIYYEYMQSPLKVYLNKTSVLEFPVIEINSEHNKALRSREDGITKLAFIGTLYDDIRSPSYLFCILKELVRRGNQVHLDLVGPLVGDIEIPQADWLTYHGRLGVAEAKAFMQQADILVNIGNSIKNQMPSKIFEYFNTGKPIINFYKIDNCPTLHYANRYPYCISIDESKKVDEEICEQIEDFIRKNQDSMIPSYKVMDMFPECTTNKVSDNFLKAVQNAIMRAKGNKDNS